MGKVMTGSRDDMAMVAKAMGEGFIQAVGKLLEEWRLVLDIVFG